MLWAGVVHAEHSECPDKQQSSAHYCAHTHLYRAGQASWVRGLYNDEVPRFPLKVQAEASRNQGRDREPPGGRAHGEQRLIVAVQDDEGQGGAVLVRDTGSSQVGDTGAGARQLRQEVGRGTGAHWGVVDVQDLGIHQPAGQRQQRG